jgi:hypothetical protein
MPKWYRVFNVGSSLGFRVFGQEKATLAVSVLTALSKVLPAPFW